MKRFVTRSENFESWEVEATYSLPEDIVHHVCDVMRLNSGDEIEIIDAGQHLVSARLIGNGQVVCRSNVLCTHSSRRFGVTMGVALFKWPRFEWMLEKLTEIGVQRIVPIACERSVIKISDWSSKSARLEKIMLEASRQSLNPCPPQLDAPLKLPAFLEASQKDSTFFAHLGPYPSVVQIQDRLSGEISFVIGPEGGFSPSEVELLEQSASPISLGPTVLRAETAAIVCASTLSLLG